tara:strand:- start:3743 stop:6082 length:2340 start_codon:yes stop_codon:yes gene_type:complete
MAYTAVDKIAQQSFNRIRDNRKRASRQETLGVGLDALSGALKSSYQSSLEDFQNNSQLVEAEALYEASQDKLKQAQEEVRLATTYAGGKGKYLEDNHAKDIATNMLNSEIMEGTYTADSYGKVLSSLTKDLVYGKEQEDGTRDGKGMLADFNRLEIATRKIPKTLEEYQDFVNDKLAFPENTGGYYLQRLWNNKTPKMIEQEALDRIIKTNGLDQGTAAFNVAYDAWNLGLNPKKTNSLIEKIGSKISSMGILKPETITSRQIKDIEIRDDNGNIQLKIPVIEEQGVEKGGLNPFVRRTHLPGHTNSILYIGNEEARKNLKILQGENFNEIFIVADKEKRKSVDPHTGAEVENTDVFVRQITGPNAGDVTREVARERLDVKLDSDNIEKIYANLLSSETKLTDEIVDAHTNRVYALAQEFKNHDQFNYTDDTLQDGLKSRFGENMDDAAWKKAVKLSMASSAKLGSNLALRYNFQDRFNLNEAQAVTLGREIAAMLEIENNTYIANNLDKTGNYGGADLVKDPLANNIRVLGALNKLMQLGDFKNKFGFSDENVKEIKKFAYELGTYEEGIEEFKRYLTFPEGEGRKAPIVNEDKIAYFFDENLPKSWNINMEARKNIKEETFNNFFMNIDVQVSNGKYAKLYDYLMYKIRNVPIEPYLFERKSKEVEGKFSTGEITQDTETGTTTVVPEINFETIEGTKVYNLIQSDIKAKDSKTTKRGRKEKRIQNSIRNLIEEENKLIEFLSDPVNQKADPEKYNETIEQLRVLRSYNQETGITRV